jgi:preprotein translocase subunit SecG
MTLNTLPNLAFANLALTWGKFFWNAGAIVIFLMSLLLILIILIQDAKESGLGGAFGGGGGDSVFGTRAARGINRFTAYLGLLFVILLLCLGAFNPRSGERSLPGDESTGAGTTRAEPEAAAITDDLDLDSILKGAGSSSTGTGSPTTPNTLAPPAVEPPNAEPEGTSP